MQLDSNFTPTHWIILAALLGSFAMFGVGAWMLYAGIAAEGAVDIKTTLASGTIRTGSAGIFLIFFAFLVIIVSLMLLASRANHRTPNEALPASRPLSRRLLPALFAILIALLLCCLGAAVFPDGARMAFLSGAFVLSTAMFGLVTAYIRAVADDEA